MSALRRLAFVVLCLPVLLCLMLLWIATGGKIDANLDRFTDWGTK